MSSMLQIPVPNPTPSRPIALGAGQPSLVFLKDAALNRSVKDQICALAPRWPAERIAEIVEANFAVKVSRAQIHAVWAERTASETQAAPAPEEERTDKQSVHPSDAQPDCLLTPPPESSGIVSFETEPSETRCPETESSGPAEQPFVIATDAMPTRTVPGPEPVAEVAPPSGPADHGDAPTRTVPGPDNDPHEIMPTEVRAFIIDRMARRYTPWIIATEVLQKFNLEVDQDEIVVCWRDRDELITQTGPGPQSGSRLKLSDEIKEFIVKRIACYETPSRIAAAVRVNFGIDVDRRRILDYNPRAARPPAQRWIDLHDATRARFPHDVSAIGVAQKVIRLKMLDRFAEAAEDNHDHDKAARFLQQAARECGGFYEKRPMPRAAAVDNQV